MERIDVEVLEIDASSFTEKERTWKSVTTTKFYNGSRRGNVEVLLFDETNQV